MKEFVLGFSLSILLPFASSAAMGDVDNFLAVKGQQFRQTNAGAPVQISQEKPFRASGSVEPTAPGQVTGAWLRLPNKQTLLLTNHADSFAAELSFSNKAQLDAKFGTGLYNFTIQTPHATNRPALKLPADMYPSTPRVMNWQDAQEVDAAFPFTLAWGAFTNGTTNDYIVFSVSGTNDPDGFSTPGILETNALRGTHLSATVPAGKLWTNESYLGRLLFVKRTGLNSTDVPGAIGISGYYKETLFPLVTLPEPPSAGRLEFSTRHFSARENDGVAQIVVTRSGSQGAVDVMLASSPGSAVANVDYTEISTLLSFADGETFKTLTVPLLNDFLLETNETVNLTLSSPNGGAILGNRSQTVLTILDDEIATAGRLQFGAVNVPVAEAGSMANLIVTRVGGSAGTVEVNFHTVSGTAAEGADFMATNGTLTLAPGQTSKTIPIRIWNDSLDETNETFTVILDASTGGAALGTNTIGRVTITDDDSGGLVSFKSAHFVTNENSGSAVITVVRTRGAASDVSVYFTTQDGETNPATAGVDYQANSATLVFGSNELSKTFTVAITNDFAVETNETVRLQLANPAGGAQLGIVTSAILTIRDDESSIGFTNANYTVGEAGPMVTLHVVRKGALITPASVSFSTVDETAVSTNDYRGTNRTLQFPIGMASQIITLPIVNDAVVDSNETFRVFLHTPTGGATLATASQQTTNTTVVIKDNDAGGAITFSTTNYLVPEIGPTGAIILKRTGGSAAVAVNLTLADETATAGADYSNATQTVFFKAGELSKTVLVQINNDALDETNETVSLVLSHPQGGASLGAITNATLTIADNDSGGVFRVGLLNYSTNENAGSLVVTVVRTGGAASGVTVAYGTQNGSATAGLDYTSVHGTLTFGSNELSKSISVPILNDTVAEGLETFGLVITNATGGATVGTNQAAVLAIVDDESSLSLTNAVYIINEAGPAVGITVLRSGARTTSVSVQFTTVNGTAVSTNDYRGTNLTLNFPANVGQQTVMLPIVSDTVDENHETFSVRLSNPLGGVQLGTITNAVVTITDDDLAGVIQFGTPTFSVAEGVANASVVVTRTSGFASGVTVQFATVSAGSTATVGSDYTAVASILTFNANEVSKTVLIPIAADSLAESTETVKLLLSNATGGAVLGGVTSAILNIADKPDPNAVPITGPEFMTGTVAGVNFTARSVGAATFTGESGMNLVAAWISGSGLSTISHLLTIDPFPFQVGTYQMDNSSSTHGFMNYAKGELSGTGRAWSVADGFSSVGSYGTFIYDAIDRTNKMVSGRFSFHARETTDTVAPHGGFIEITGKFRCKYH